MEKKKKIGCAKHELIFLAAPGGPQAVPRFFVGSTSPQSSVIHGPLHPKNDKNRRGALWTKEAQLTQSFVVTLPLCLSFLLPMYARMSQTHPRGPYSGLRSLAQFGGF